ncbi:thiamine pyrophosphate-binding protein [Bosea sp. ANAM02]|uniref:thiamine pyrophosphate-binding protein n=1 Tax=Bosea sp. ANAM02 TaxID=2020412 RepID=UPI00140EE6D7|nr:thiamine pyrophosphate-binding protein [Bosea sp. ANAM02]BCB21013.1 thiamine pyrophosphate protein [Bosea sp. ANAM02]
MANRTGGQILVDQLLIHGATDAFCVPGESYLAVLDALHDASMKVTICRAEGGACMMAEAAGKLTGKPGICFVTRGPGATNASPGIHIADQDSTPLILFVGQIDGSMREREAFQELDYRAVFGTMTKWATEIDDAARIPEIIGRAFHVATSGRPGPVVIALPEDVLIDIADVADAEPYNVTEQHPAPAQMTDLAKRFAAAKSPIAILGGSRWSPEAIADFQAFAERFDLPVAVSFRRQMLFPADHPNFAGDLGIGPNPRLLARIKESDLVLLVGGRLSEMPSQSYTLFGIPNPGRPLVHVHADPEELGRVYRPTLAINASPAGFCAALKTIEPPKSPAWKGAGAAAHEAYIAWSEQPAPVPGAFHPGEMVRWLRSQLPEDAIMCNGAGNYATWVHRFHRFNTFATQLAPTCGSMGYGVPAAIGAKRLFPDRTVIAFAGDGCFLMNGQDFATAVQYDLPVIVIVVDNGMYGTIRMHQEREYPGRVSATTLKNPDFAAYAKAFGGHGERVEKTEEFAPAFERAVKSGKPAIIHCLLDPEAITPAKSLSTIRAEAFAAQGKK